MHAIGLAQSGTIALHSAFALFDFVDDKDNVHYRGIAEVYNNGDVCVFPMTLNAYNHGIEGATGHLKDLGKKTAQFTIDYDTKWKAVVGIDVEGM
ncbi:hypothetical protein E3Q12_03836 [Wallemia mellicola]|nr:hypothetical protein E3Q12_03836 [Wallemia mellicola]TIC51485.1 hypothetical protein E3Q04_03795 [Wallemia mellicola]